MKYLGLFNSAYDVGDLGCFVQKSHFKKTVAMCNLAIYSACQINHNAIMQKTIINSDNVGLSLQFPPDWKIKILR